MCDQVKNGNDEIKSWLNENVKNLYEAVALTAVFCSVKEYEKLEKKIKDKKLPWSYPCISITQTSTGKTCLIRRKDSEVDKGAYIDENGKTVYIDDNTQINTKFKKITGMKNCEKYMTCHIWEDSKEPEVFSAVANVTLLPAVIGGLSDHCDEVKQLLQYRAYELYEWKPVTREIPIKPQYYDELVWQYPKDVDPAALHRVAANVERRSIEDRLKLWATRKNSIVYSVISIVKAAGDQGADKAALLDKIKEIAKNPQVTLSSLMTDTGNAYGKVFEYTQDNKRVVIIAQYQALINDLWE